jgi:hypothetical protein
MDVLQREVEMYENEIRTLKDFKSPKRGSQAVGRTTPRRSSTTIGELTPNPRGAADDSYSAIAFEATLFRPLLQEALQETARWKAAATGTALLDLPPLPMSPLDGFTQRNDNLIYLSSAVANARIQKASMQLVDLTNTKRTPRAQLRDIKAKSAEISERLETIMLRCRERCQ